MQIYGEHLSERGFDYAGAKRSDTFKDYHDNVCTTLLDLDIDDMNASMSPAEKKSFFINLYNTLTIHGHIALGNPQTPEERNEFFPRCGYLIGKELFTLDVIEHGVLRKNSPKAFQTEPLLRADDPRLRLAVDELDPRIHFALNCGAKSCPPISFYDDESSKLEKQLTAAASGFCNSNDNLVVGVVEAEEQREGVVVTTTTLRLSKIFLWYRPDFGKSEEDFLRRLEGYVTDQDKLKLLKRKTTSLNISYFDYDWSENGVG